MERAEGAEQSRTAVRASEENGGSSGEGDAPCPPVLSAGRGGMLTGKIERPA